MKPRPKLCMVTTSPIVVRFFLLPHLRLLVRYFDVTLVANADCSSILGDLTKTVTMVVIPVEREISPRQDFAALIQLYQLFRRERYDAVVTVAPKAGLLGHISAFLARMPYRCHVFQGEVWASRQGVMRFILRTADKLIARTATEVLVVSESERAFLINEGILSPSRSTVLGSGSICGVDTSRFAPNPEIRRQVRDRYSIPQDATLVLFVGRLHKDKGILDLVAAWSKLAATNPDLNLAIVGPDESGLVPQIEALAGSALAPRLRVNGQTDAPEEWMAAADILCLPSYREGFGNVIIEAGATEVPVIASRIYGIADALIENVTGLAHRPANQQELAACLEQLAGNPERRASFGKAARAMVIEKFEQSRVIQGYADHFVQRCKMVSSP